MRYSRQPWSRKSSKALWFSSNPIKRFHLSVLSRRTVKACSLRKSTRSSEMALIFTWSEGTRTPASAMLRDTKEKRGTTHAIKSRVNCPFKSTSLRLYHIVVSNLSPLADFYQLSESEVSWCFYIISIFPSEKWIMSHTLGCPFPSSPVGERNWTPPVESGHYGNRVNGFCVSVPTLCERSTHLVLMKPECALEKPAKVSGALLHRQRYNLIPTHPAG